MGKGLNTDIIKELSNLKESLYKKYNNFNRFILIQFGYLKGPIDGWEFDIGFYNTNSQTTKLEEKYPKLYKLESKCITCNNGYEFENENFINSEAKTAVQENEQARIEEEAEILRE